MSAEICISITEATTASARASYAVADLQASWLTSVPSAKHMFVRHNGTATGGPGGTS
ncbi:MAG TPA: hypothetical protein VJM33_11210 [Microthrixaceae bacterium]|nr:hypothetical protein [Microthrixaceae bacterium]